MVFTRGDVSGHDELVIGKADYPQPLELTALTMA